MQKVRYGKEARKALLRGVNGLADVVESTLGPSGHSVILDLDPGNPVATKDGVTIAKAVKLNNSLENAGAQMLKQASVKTAEEAGDGTTTATVLARELYREASKAEKSFSGYNSVQVQQGMEYAAKKINLECLEQVFHDSCLGDFKAAYKLLYNVLDNAYKYSDNGSRVQFIVYELPFKDQKEAIYRFVVKDWGCGIEEQRLATVFTPFYSFINQSDHKDSSGLGLSIAKFIVDRLGGSISIDSKEGAGTIVTIDLHMAFANTTQVKEEVRVEEQLTVNHMRLLLVQKNPLELLVLRKLLESKGAKIDCTESVEAAAELMKKHDIGYYSFLIVDMDNILSQMRGEALKKLKLHPLFWESIPQLIVQSILLSSLSTSSIMAM